MSLLLIDIYIDYYGSVTVGGMESSSWPGYE